MPNITFVYRGPFGDEQNMMIAWDGEEVVLFKANHVGALIAVAEMPVDGTALLRVLPEGERPK